MHWYEPFVVVALWVTFFLVARYGFTMQNLIRVNKLPKPVKPVLTPQEKTATMARELNEQAQKRQAFYESLRPFDDTICDACNSDTTTVKYCDFLFHGIDTTDFSDLSTKKTPHLHRTCTNCGFQWLTRTLAQEREEEAKCAR